ncbi:unnamed protein product [Toxocara canis]|uniref:Neur_chan_memb domain-containing protein n=1 Tax=Toxocara canis TaxID=6265 RepID=A0A183V1H2_TOXCA|nr:unnamed protein product [Toxocara canis]
MITCRISLTVICMQNLAKYPLDSQRCTLRILSYAYDINHLVIKWNTASPIETNEEIRMPDMRLKEILPGLRNSTYATGVWSCATAEFFVNREIMHHILQSYLPTALIVVISWFNFWLDVEAVPGRVSLSITTLLTLATQSSAARIALPQASYVKAIDVWMGACMTFVFSAMIEFTVVNFCVRHKPKRSRLIKTGKINISNRMQQLVAGYKQGTHTFIYKKRMPHCPYSANENSEEVKHHLEIRGIRELHHDRISRVAENRKYAQMIDRRSRIYFPLSFVIFNAIYWIYYLHFADND